MDPKPAYELAPTVQQRGLYDLCKDWAFVGVTNIEAKNLGLLQVEDDVWLVSFMEYDAGCEPCVRYIPL